MFLFASCGGNQSESKDAKDSKDVKSEKDSPLKTLDEMGVKLTKQVDDYCTCLETKTIKDCQPLYDLLGDTWKALSDQTTEAYTKHKIEKADYDRLLKIDRDQFDRKAACAKANMAK